MFAGVKEELAEDVKVYSSFSCGDHRSFGTGEGSGEIAVMEILVRHNFFFFSPQSGWSRTGIGLPDSMWNIQNLTKSRAT